MTIKELEGLLEMTRANIRYYEQEGLLHPQRQKNGYRDYSQQDVLRLKKIKLLRELGISISDIKMLQNGELMLSEEMQRRIVALEKQQKESERIKAICTEICLQHVSYQQLDADRYLSGTYPAMYDSLPEQKDFQEEYLGNDRLPAILPLRRFLARIFDIVLLLEASICVISLFRENYNAFLPLIGTTAVLQVISILIEPVLLHVTGTTVGKWIFGLSLTDLDGRRLSYQAAFWRTVKVYFFGMGFGIPFLNLYCLYKSYINVKEGWKASWDDEIEYLQKPDVTYCWFSHFPNVSWRYILLVSVFLASFAATNSCIRYALLPVNRGDITLEQFVENYNQVANYFGYKEYFYRLKPDGTFYTAQEIYQKRKEEQNLTGSASIDMFGEYEMQDFSYTFEGKYLKQVAMHVELDNYTQTSYFIYPRKPMVFAALAFAGAQDKIGFLKNERNVLAEKILENSFMEGFSYKLGEMDIICKTACTGFSSMDDYLVAWDEKNWLHLDYMVGIGTDTENICVLDQLNFYQ